MSELTWDDLDQDEPSSSTRLAPTAEQAAILEAAKSSNDSMMIEAMAGCSKTSTIEILIRSLPPVPTCYVVFNKKNKEEAEKKFKDKDSPWSHLGRADHCNVVTLNGLGHNAWAKAIGRRLILKTDKIHAILKEELSGSRRDDVSREDFINIMALVRRARVNGLIPQQFNKVGLIEDTDEQWAEIASSLWLEEISEEHFYLARRVLTESIRQALSGQIDFDDQIYMSALFGGVFPRYQRVFGDEVQDYSPLNQRQLQFTAAGRLFLVGDHRQAIYAFRGADSESMHSLRSLQGKWIDLPLSTTFRCPKLVVERQQQHAPGFTAYKDNPDGQISHFRDEWSITQIPATEEVAILCRNNAPLFKAAINCLKAKRGCVILGNEIGRGLISLAKKIEPNEGASISDFLIKVNDWKDRESQKALLNNKEAKAGIIQDKAECLIELCDGLTHVSQIIYRLEELFEKSNVRITLATGHKAKGMEWSTVIFLDPWRIPSRYAKEQAEQGDSTALTQEMNLRYVIETRAKKHLILANSEHMK